MRAQRAARWLLAAAVAGSLLALAPAAEARARPSHGGPAKGDARSRSSPAPSAREAVRPVPQTRVARGRARFGRGIGVVGFHHRLFLPWWWHADFWWWGWPYGYGYPCVGAYPCYGFPVDVGVSSAPAVVELDVTPGRAVVEVDGEEVGYARDYSGAWDRLELRPGRHEISLSAPGHKTLRIEFEARPGSFHRLELELEQGEGTDPRSITIGESGARRRSPREDEARGTPKRGFLAVRVEPGDAAVYLDGEFLGSGGELARLHGAVAVAPGPHRIEAARPGYRSESREVTVEADGRIEVEFALKRGPD